MTPNVNEFVRCRAVLLDMDGTLVDSAPAVESAWTAWSQRNGLNPEEVLAVCHGPDAATTIRRFLPEIGPSARHVKAHLERECADTDGVRPAAGAQELVAWLDGQQVPWAVVTNAHLRLARARLGAAGIKAPVIVSFEDVAHGKPHPQGYLLGARRLGVEPHSAVGVEDSDPGLAAARAAGLVVASVGGAQSADIVCEDLRQLLRFLALSRG